MSRYATAVFYLCDNRPKKDLLAPISAHSISSPVSSSRASANQGCQALHRLENVDIFYGHLEYFMGIWDVFKTIWWVHFVII
jgi:hypothetical protein